MRSVDGSSHAPTQQLAGLLALVLPLVHLYLPAVNLMSHACNSLLMVDPGSGVSALSLCMRPRRRWEPVMTLHAKEENYDKGPQRETPVNKSRRRCVNGPLVLTTSTMTSPGMPDPEQGLEIRKTFHSWTPAWQATCTVILPGAAPSASYSHAKSRFPSWHSFMVDSRSAR